MTLQYQELHRLDEGHTKSITTVAFSPKGNYIATSGLDGRICIWGLGNGALLHLLRGPNAAVSLVWAPPDENTLICGLADGSIASIDLSGDFLEITAVWAHPYPVECLAINNGSLVVGAGCKLSVWGWDPVDKRVLKKLDLDPPPRASQDELHEVLVTSIHWTSSPRHPSLVVVTYMNHGAVFLEPRTWTRVHTLPLNGQILGASVSPDGKRIAVFNVLRGCDVYSLTSGVRLCAMNHEVLEHYPTPVLWIHGGLALLEGSTAGQLTLWDLVDHVEGNDKVDPRPRILYRLPIPKFGNVMAISAYYNTMKDQFYIAAGVMSVNGSSTCTVWIAEELPRSSKNGLAFCLCLSWTLVVLLSLVLVSVLRGDMVFEAAVGNRAQ